MSIFIHPEVDKPFLNFYLPTGREYRVLFVTDVHLIDTEFSGTHRYVEHQESIIERLIKGAEAGVFNTLIFGGDLTDRTYKKVNKVLQHITLFARLYDALEGRVFKVLGNHTLNKAKNNSLTMFLVGEIKSARISSEHKVISMGYSGELRTDFGLTHPLLNVVDRLIINGNVFNLFHYSRYQKNYYDPLADLPFSPYNHVGCYHDHILNQAAKNYIFDLLNDGKYSIPSLHVIEETDILNNVDHAVVADIHTRIGEFKHRSPSTGKETLVDIPGTLGRTKNSAAERHNKVQLPLFIISENGQLRKEHVDMELADYRSIFKMQELDERKEQKDKLAKFNQAISLLKKYISIEDMIKESTVSDRTKQILLEGIAGREVELTYRKNSDNLNLLRRD